MKGRKHSVETKKRMSESMVLRMKFFPSSVSGNGTKGWYKGIFFRSALEFAFMKHLELDGIDISKDVKTECFQIKYIFKDEERTYVPDFYIEKYSTVYEVKYSYWIDDPQVQAKADAAKAFFQDQGIEYKFVTEKDIETYKLVELQKIPEVRLHTVDERLEEMFYQQLQFMKLLQEKRSFPKFPVDLNSKEGQKIVKDVSHECMHELFEAVHLLKNSKSHRETEVKEFDKEAFLEEMVDALHYFFEICILANIPPEVLFEAFMSKGKVNEDRILKGY